MVDRFGAAQAFSGGLKIKTTLDLDLQPAAEEAVNNHLSSPSGPAAALVAIDNQTGEVRAMVGGRPATVEQAPFNLATQGQRQPGSAFKAFVLAAALRKGIDPYSTWESRKKLFDVPNSADPNEKFVVNNFEGSYSGITTLAGATAHSDNSVFAEVGHQGGNPQHRPDRARDGHPDARVDEHRDDAGRPEAGRHPARHGARLRDARHRRQARHGHARRQR